MSGAEKKRKVSYLSTAQLATLSHACIPLKEALGGIYLVGSSTERPDFRDVDVRSIVEDEKFDAIFGGREFFWSVFCWVYGNPNRFRYVVGSDVERLLSYVEILPNGCWNFTGAKYKGGHGALYFKGRPRGAHIVSYTLLVGEVPEGLELDHLCHDPKTCINGPHCPHRSCVNPDHLEPVTHQENINRGAPKLNHDWTPLGRKVLQDAS